MQRDLSAIAEHLVSLGNASSDISALLFLTRILHLWLQCRLRVQDTCDKCMHSLDVHSKADRGQLNLTHDMDRQAAKAIKSLGIVKTEK